MNTEVKVLTIDDILESKTFIKNKTTSYGSPKDFLNPFLELANQQNVDIRVQGEKPVVNINDDGSENISYGRVLVQANYKEFSTNEVQATVGYLYSLDTARPMVKAFTGSKVFACTNLCVFGADHLYTGDLGVAGSLESSLAHMKGFLMTAGESFERNLRAVEALKAIRYETRAEIEQLYGQLVMKSIANKQVGIRNFVAAIDEFTNPESPYVIYPEKGTDAWNVYNGFTQYVTDKVSLDSAPNKTNAIAELFDINYAELV